MPSSIPSRSMSVYTKQRTPRRASAATACPGLEIGALGPATRRDSPAAHVDRHGNAVGVAFQQAHRATAGSAKAAVPITTRLRPGIERGAGAPDVAQPATVLDRNTGLGGDPLAACRD